ncbi:hypothetical protein BpHYR1_029918 [Brachionus plicatilis]|uniref:Uncharacterized protein n=1 Tax=Brachionus plicatilis TaxID=10195 RepID=A0A3M7SVX3_BRAPC|nr:hypothetical protein BpHYR1_029918 [Brachionus plicatilis]
MSLKSSNYIVGALSNFIRLNEKKLFMVLKSLPKKSNFKSLCKQAIVKIRNTLEACLLKVNLLSIVTPKSLNSFTTIKICIIFYLLKY